MNIKLLKNSNFNEKDKDKLNEKFSAIKDLLDEIIDIVPYNYNVNTLDEVLKTSKRLDMIKFCINEELEIKRGIQNLG